MLLAMSGEPKKQESKDAIEFHPKCRIPQRLSSARHRCGKTNSIEQTKNEESKRLSKTYFGELRPKSANRVTDGLGDLRLSRPEREKLYPAQKSPIPTLNKKSVNASTNKIGKHVITVPLKQKPKSMNKDNLLNLPDQETIRKYEDLEIKQDFSDTSPLSNDIEEVFMDFNDQDSLTSKSEKILTLTHIWQEKITQFEGIKNELNDRQNAIMEVYASLRSTKQKLSALGQNAKLPSTDDLHITNDTNMTPNQLLKLWAQTKYQKNEVKEDTKHTVTIDMKKLRDMPLKLVATCEQALEARKNLIEWLEHLKNNDKGCPKSTLGKKINEFIAENDMLSSSLKNKENEFLKEVSDFIRTCWDEAITLQLRNESLVYELSELSSLNGNLKKQISSYEHQKSHANKLKVEALEAELKQEKEKRICMSDKLSRAVGQIKIGEERATLLESALNEAQAQTRTLERTKQQLHEKNEQLQQEFNNEFHKLKECIKQSTVHLEEIALVKETLQEEKEDLKNKLEELSKHYEESMTNMKEELSKNVINLIDVEKKYNDEMEIKKHLQATIESQCASLVESELRYKGMLQKLQEKESALDELINYKSKFEQVVLKLDETNVELEKYKEQLLQQTDTINKLEQKLRNSYELENNLREDNNKKIEDIQELEIKQQILIEQSHENESKMEIYEEQLLTLKKHITQLKEHFGEFENLNNLQEQIKHQNIIYNETRRVNNEMNQEIENKKNNLKHIVDSIAEQEELIKQKENLLKELSEKENEQIDISQLHEKITEKNSEIEALMNSVETKKEHIDQLEKIILTLEDRNRQSYMQKRRDHDKICALEKRLNEFEYSTKRNNKNIPSNDLDTIIKILEDELENPHTTVKSPIIEADSNYFNIIDHYEKSNVNHSEYKDYERKQSFTRLEKDKTPKKHARENIMKKIDISSNNYDKHTVESLRRKQAITNIDTQKWIPSIDSKCAFIPESNSETDNFAIKEKNATHNSKDKLRHVQCVVINQARDQKINKMRKLTSHQLQ